MKIGILTHYQVYNHGALLQMYGLQEVLKSLGAQPVILTYDKNFDFADKSKMIVYSKSPLFMAKYILDRGIRKTIFNFFKYRKLNKFSVNNYSFMPLSACDCDYVCIGSDEVFSLDVGVNKMMYGQGINCKNIFSYAGSFGQTDLKRIEQKNCSSLIAEGFKTFKALSVRDQNSADIVQKLTGLRPQIVCDPVFLYGFQKELNAPCRKKIKHPYLLVYAYDYNMNEPCEVSAIKRYARKRNLKIVSVGFYHKWADININAAPMEFISLFKNAQCAVTDTFHGSIFSVLANIPFAVFVRGSNKNKMTYLLNTTGVSNANMDNWEDLPLILSRPHNWQEINATIAKMRAEGLTFIKKAITGEDAK